MMDTINDILAVIGLLSLLITTIRFIWVMFSGSEWIDNILIRECPLSDDLEEKNHWFCQYYPNSAFDSVGEFATKNYFVPQNTIIKKVILKRVVDESISDGKLKYKKVHVFYSISPNEPICLIVERREAIAQYMIEWRTEYGGKAQYYFYSNLRDGNNNATGFKYKFGIVSKLRKIINLK